MRGCDALLGGNLGCAAQAPIPAARCLSLSRAALRGVCPPLVTARPVAVPLPPYSMVRVGITLCRACMCARVLSLPLFHFQFLSEARHRWVPRGRARARGMRT